MSHEADEQSTISAAIRIIVSYDVSRSRPSECSMVYQYVFGRTVTKETSTGKRKYHYPGLVAKPGVEALGQSVLMMREKDAEDFHAFLWRMRIPHTRTEVWVRL